MSLTVGNQIFNSNVRDIYENGWYLGAAGHVVILNEGANQYLHVHPQDEQKPVFETQFDHPGTYKIWAEFKQAGKVRVFPFIIKIK